MCEELRKLHKIDSIIPQPLLKVYVDLFVIAKLMFVIEMYFLSYYRDRPNNAVVVWNKKPLIELVRSLSHYQEPKSTVVITEITDEEENEMNNSSNTMCVEENK